MSHQTDRPAPRLLVVEDDRLQAEGLEFILRQEGYEVEVAPNGAEGVAAARRRLPPDLVLLDVALPDLSGVEVARRLRAQSAVPIIMLTARRQDVDKVVGLDAGADDYVTKPFNPSELLARVRAQLRRRALGAPGPAAAEGVLSAGALRVDVGIRRVFLGDRPVELSAREFEIVRILAEAGGRVVDRRDIFDSVWGAGFFGDERALDVYIRLIRKKIEPDPARPRYVHTVRGVGYRLAEELAGDEQPDLSA